MQFMEKLPLLAISMKRQEYIQKYHHLLSNSLDFEKYTPQYIFCRRNRIEMEEGVAGQVCNAFLID